MSMKHLYCLLSLLLFATKASAATLLTMTGAVTFEDYGANPSPLAGDADSVAISVTYDDTIASNADLLLGDTQIALYRSAVLATRIDIFDASGGVLDSITPPDATIRMAYQPSTGNSEMVLNAVFAPGPNSPFVELDVTFFSDNMFNSVSLAQITQGRLAFADLLSEGDLETALNTFDVDGIAFDIDLRSLNIKPNVSTPGPVPAPPTIFALLTALAGLVIWSRRKRCDAVSVARHTQ